MTIYELRDMLETADITDLPLRCATYSRVSTGKETQAASLVNMTDDFRSYVEQQPNWTFAKSYIDDGKSGLTTKKRNDFLKLLTAGAAGEYDLLVTGEISRFGRNTMEGLENIKYLKDKGIPVIFLYDDLNTYDPDCDIQIQQKFVDAENESRKISKRVKRGHQKSIKKGHVLGNRIWGYKKVNCKLVIDEETAPMVREIFKLYATNEYSMKEIEQIIYDKGYRNTNGNRLSHTTMANIIQNPKYKGYYVGGKVKVVDIFNKRQKFLPKDEWVTYKDESGETVPALVSEELWQKANDVFQRRSIDVKGRRNCSTHKNTYTGKIYCGVDGAPYYCKDVHYKGSDISKWVCSHKIKNGAESCPSVALYEDQLNAVVVELFREHKQNIEELSKKYLEEFRSQVLPEDNRGKEKGELEQELAVNLKAQDDLLNLKLEGSITLEQFSRKNENLLDREKAIRTAINEIEDTAKLEQDMENRLKQFETALTKGALALDHGGVSRDFVDNFISKILVTPLDIGQIKLEISVISGDKEDFCLIPGKGRTGQTFKKMIESYEKSL